MVGCLPHLLLLRIPRSPCTDLLSSQDATVSGTFGHGSSLEKYFYYGEIIMAAFTYIKVRSPLVFVGLIMLFVFTRLGFSLAG